MKFNPSYFEPINPLIDYSPDSSETEETDG